MKFKIDNRESDRCYIDKCNIEYGDSKDIIAISTVYANDNELNKYYSIRDIMVYTFSIQNNLNKTEIDVFKTIYDTSIVYNNRLLREQLYFNRKTLIKKLVSKYNKSSRTFELAINKFIKKYIIFEDSDGCIKINKYYNFIPNILKNPDIKYITIAI